MASAGKILIIPRGNWVSGSEYKKLDMVYFNGSSYIAKNDLLNSTIAPDIDTNNWQLMAGGFDNENIITKDMEISQEDIEPIEGKFPVPSKGDTVKTAFSKIKKFFEDFKLFKDGIITLGELRNNGTTTETGKYALDAAYGKTLSDLINQLSDFQNLSLKSKELTLEQINSDTKNFYIGQITQSTAIAIGITDAVCPYMIAHLPFGTYYPSQILLSTSEEKRMFYRMCNNGIWESPKELITTGKLINNGLTTEVGKYPLDAAFGKTLSDQITQLNSNLEQENYILSFDSVNFGIKLVSQNLISINKKIAFAAFIENSIEIPNGGIFANIISNGNITPVANRCDFIAVNVSQNISRAIYIAPNTGNLIPNGEPICIGTWIILGICTLNN